MFVLVLFSKVVLFVNRAFGFCTASFWFLDSERVGGRAEVREEARKVCLRVYLLFGQHVLV